MATLLVIEDELILAKNIAKFFEKAGHSVEIALDGAVGLQTAYRVQPDVVLVDFQLPGMDGLEVIRALQKVEDPPRIIMVTGHASVSLAVDAMKAGSMDLLTKPVTLMHLKEVVDRALTERGERRALNYYRQRDAQQSSLDAIVGNSASILNLRELIHKVANIEPADGSPAPAILITGETGTGKELVARACHQTSARVAGPFMEINCAALPGQMVEGELFGFEKGAFTDAHARKIGLIEAADGGTLFLDEIGELDLGLQAKLLRVLENLRVRRLGSLTDRQVNVRIVAATNRDLEEQVRQGRFRADLMYRLKVFQIHLAPLRERPDDIPLLAQHFLKQLASRYAQTPIRIEASAQAALATHDWPGNVRELRNVLERAVLTQRSDTLSAKDLTLVGIQKPASAKLSAGGVSLDAMEREHLLTALTTCDWNVSRAAKYLHISRDTLRYRMERHGLQR
ncbi:MAG: sigma-54-dependent Fis family transcriptional regulator [Rhodoferax sp.]|nr:sigma-54-dependent Fis family transcriptional regulator [Rhodoferax sp.]